MKLTINRAPVLTLWATVVAERLGYDADEALTLGRAVAGLNAASKARTLGLARSKDAPGAKTPAPKRATPDRVQLLGREVPIVRTPKGLRASEEGKPASPDAVRRYLAGKFGDGLEPARAAMTVLAGSLGKDVLAAQAFALYERFRPGIPAGVTGWGAKGELDLDAIRAMAKGRGRR
jgi:hypothetical protein